MLLSTLQLSQALALSPGECSFFYFIIYSTLFYRHSQIHIHTCCSKFYLSKRVQVALHHFFLFPMSFFYLKQNSQIG